MMNRMMLKTIVFMWMAVACMVQGPVFAQWEHRDSQRGWSMTVRKDWEKMPQELVDQANYMAKGVMGSDVEVKFINGFLPADPERGFAYILVQEIKATNRGATWEEIEKAVDSMLGIEDAINEMTKSIGLEADFESVEFDRKTARYKAKAKMKLADGTKLDALMVGYVSWDRIIQFNCYSTPRDSRKMLQVIEAMLATFEYDDGLQFKADLDSSSPGADSTDNADIHEDADEQSSNTSPSRSRVSVLDSAWKLPALASVLTSLVVMAAFLVQRRVRSM